MFVEYSDSDDDTPNYDDGYIGAAERKKKAKKALKKITKKDADEEGSEEEIEEEQTDADAIDEDEDDEQDIKSKLLKKQEADEDEIDKASEELDYQLSIHASPYAVYRKVIKYIAPEDSMSIDLLSRFDYADLAAKETQRIEKSDYLFIDPGQLDRADLIAEATINARKCPYNISREVGHYVDHTAKVIYLYHEVMNPNEMKHIKLNATSML